MRPVDADKVIENIDEWLDSVGYATVGKGLSYYGELIGCVDETPTITPSDWTSVEDALPDKHTQVLMWSSKWNIAEAGSYYNGHFWVYNEIGDGYIAENITHWMPLPEPPKED